MTRSTDTLVDLHSKLVVRMRDEGHALIPSIIRERRMKLRRLARCGVVTVGDLISRFSRLSTRLKCDAIDLITILDIRQAAPLLLESMQDRELRLGCANAIAMLKPGARFTRAICAIGRRELGSSRPDPEWLHAVVLGLRRSDDRDSAEILVTLFERRDLPGTIRGDAGDKLGCHPRIRDRRSSLYRRVRQAAILGLVDESRDVQFWSMYVIASLCNVAGSRREVDSEFRKALPQLRKIAASDHSLVAGYWWPMSAEAEDAIGCIVHGRWPDPGAAERWPSNAQRGRTPP